MKKMGFSEIWLYLINQRISTVSNSILLNGYPSNPFSSQRGLRQGNPLSPYLFVICVEGLLALMLKAEMDQNIAGIRVRELHPKSPSFFFADDTLVFSKANMRDCEEILRIIQKYHSSEKSDRTG